MAPPLCTNCPDREEHKLLSDLIEKHKGSISAIAKDQRAGGLSRQGVTYRLRVHELLKAASSARIAGRVRGARTKRNKRAVDIERSRLITALGKAHSNAAAAAELGIPYRTLKRKIAALGITTSLLQQLRRQAGLRAN